MEGGPSMDHFPIQKMMNSIAILFVSRKVVSITFCTAGQPASATSNPAGFKFDQVG